jgi:hypothetical protein
MAPAFGVGSRIGRGSSIQAFPRELPLQYSPPTVPVAAKAGYFLIGDDIVDGSTWAPRADIFGQGNPTIFNGAVNVSGWPTPEGNRKSLTFNGSSTYMRLNALAAMASGDDPPLEIVIWYKMTTLNAGNTLAAWSNTGSSTPRRVFSFTTTYRVTQQSTASVYSLSGNNTMQQMVRVRWVNNGSGGNDITLWRNEELDPAASGTGTLTNTVGTQTINTFTVGAHDNGGSIVNFLNGEVFAIWIRDPAAAPLTAAEGVELHNFIMGGYDVAPLYSDATSFLLMLNFCQSNGLANGVATGVVAGLPDAGVKEMMRTPNNGVVDPVGLKSLDIRDIYHGAQHYIQSGSFAKPHHMAGVGKGATNMGSSGWDAGASGPSPTLQGFYSTSLPSECRRNIFMARARFGGSPSIQRTWWQGESDAAAGPVVAAAYGGALEAVDTYLDRYIQQAFGAGYADTPLHVMKLNPAQTGGGIDPADLATVNSQIDSFAASHPGYVRTLTWDDLTGGTYVQGDNLHATAAAMAIIAPRFIASIKSMDLSL